MPRFNFSPRIPPLGCYDSPILAPLSWARRRKNLEPEGESHGLDQSRFRRSRSLLRNQLLRERKTLTSRNRRCAFGSSVLRPGEVPQWNCGCGNCVAVRENVRFKKLSRKARTQAQLALSADGSSWFLAELLPTWLRKSKARPSFIRALCAILRLPAWSCQRRSRSRFRLLVLRELQPLRVYAAPSILRILQEENSMFGMLNRVEPQVIWTPMNSGAPFPLLTPKATSRTALRGPVLSGRYPSMLRARTSRP